MSQDTAQGWGPAVERRGRSRRWLRWLLIVLAVLVVAALVFALWLNSQLGRIEVGELSSSGGGPMHILVAGSDSRDDLTPQERVELGTGSVEGERTDTLFVMSVEGGRVALLAFPRDLWVTRCDGSAGRINAANAIGGPDCLVRTVRDVSGIDVDHYMEITFSGFRALVDAVGGVQLCLDEPINDADAHIDLPAGCQRLDGVDALGYVRVRKIDNDLMRIQRQQQFLQALAAEMSSAGTLGNPWRLAQLASDSGKAVRVDRGMGVLDLVRLARGVRGMGGGSTATHTVPTDPFTTAGGAAVLDLRTQEAEQLFARFRDGSILHTAESAEVRPDDVEVTVLNGAGVSGLAASVRDRLRDEGFEVTEIGNAERRETTVVRHGPGQEEAARLVAAHLPGGGALESVGSGGVTVLLGSDAGAAT